MSAHPSRTALIAGFAAIYLIWGSTYLGIRIAVESMPAFLMASSRFIIAGLIVAGFIALTRGFKATGKQWRDNAIIGGFLCLGGNGLVSWAEEKVPSGIATLIISAGPVYKLSGRINRLFACCSLICAHQPVIREATKIGVYCGTGIPMV